MTATSDALYQHAMLMEQERDMWKAQAELAGRWLTAAVYLSFGSPYDLTPSPQDWEEIIGKRVEIEDGTIRIIDG